ncbi:hypothetical protein EJ07DRAFT_156075 [Lizonia empirigonia]|nr:hypothetical protein EJ07DRAFT_156075 [Lizonia empirigonia]
MRQSIWPTISLLTAGTCTKPGQADVDPPHKLQPTNPAAPPCPPLTVQCPDTAFPTHTRTARARPLIKIACDHAPLPSAVYARASHPAQTSRHWWPNTDKKATFRTKCAVNMTTEITRRSLRRNKAEFSIKSIGWSAICKVGDGRRKAAVLMFVMMAGVALCTTRDRFETTQPHLTSSMSSGRLQASNSNAFDALCQTKEQSSISIYLLGESLAWWYGDMSSLVVVADFMAGR